MTFFSHKITKQMNINDLLSECVISETHTSLCPLCCTHSRCAVIYFYAAHAHKQHIFEYHILQSQCVWDQLKMGN